MPRIPSAIAPDSWQVQLLPLPKRHSRGAAFGFCAGQPVGRAETARATSAACWWPDGQPQLLAVEGYKLVQSGRASGNLIPGHWLKGSSGAMGAVMWTLTDGQPVAHDLHDKGWQRSWAMACGGGLLLGCGTPRGKLGQRAHDDGLVWRDGQLLQVVSGNGDVELCCSDGLRLAGSVAGRATLWPALDAAPLDLAPPDTCCSQISALDGDSQAGIIWRSLCARAALWHGSAASFSDLTPQGFECARILAAAGGLQAGFVRKRDCTRNGSSACDERAVLWQGTADCWLDLQALLPEPYNASVAQALLIDGDRLLIAGQASRFEVSDPGTVRESHYVPIAHPVLWQARLCSP